MACLGAETSAARRRLVRGRFYAATSLRGLPRAWNVARAAKSSVLVSYRTLAAGSKTARAHRFDTGPKRSMGHVLGGEEGNLLIRGDDAAMVHGGHAGGILSIPAKEVSLGSPRVGTIHVHAPTPHAPALQAFLADFSQQTTPL